MSTEQNKALVRRYYEAGSQNPSLEELLAPHYVLHVSMSPEPVRGIKAFKQLHAVFLTAFPNFHNTIEDMVAEGDKVVTRWTIRATHSRPFMNIPPTGKQVTSSGIAICRVASGKIVEEWSQVDMLGMLQQLGVVPAMG
jgi:steroid delta-isomerase-like uncharacterized protein